MLQGRGQRGDHIRQEEVSEADLAERSDQDVAYRSCELLATLALEAVKRHEANEDEKGDQTEGKDLGIVVIEACRQLDHGHLPN